LQEFLHTLDHEKILKKVSKELRKQKIGKNHIVFAMSAGFQLKFDCDGITVEMFVNKIVEPLNTELIANYCELEPKFQDLALYLKDWNRGVKKLECFKKGGGLNSFSICLMLLYFM
jgi:DNA polymerase sigma